MRVKPITKSVRVPTALAFAGLLIAFAATAAAQTERSTGHTMVAPQCARAEFRQFDFWAGDWDTYDVTAPSTLIARNKVTRILGGCVLHEVYEQTDGLVGESYSIYDASRGVWHQSWVTNRGGLLLLDGRREGDRLVLTGSEQGAAGASSLLRVTWWVEGAGVRETAERSTDGGKSWKPVFDILFRPHAGGTAGDTARSRP
jgi:hypothetical protein